MTRAVRFVKFYYTASHLPEHLAPALDLFLRLFLADVFFDSGLTKIQSWDSTLYLFNEEYDVPLLSPVLAAWLATGAELLLPVLLVLGLGWRFAAAGLFILNIVAVVSYHESLSDAGITQHLYWGILLAMLLVTNRNRWSLDAWLEKRVNKSARAGKLTATD